MENNFRLKLDKIKLENYKNFSSLEVEFENGVNLFVGGNGSGKTSILEAINVAIGAYFGSQPQKMQRMIDFSEIKITNGIRESFASVTGFNAAIGEWKRTIKSVTKKNDSKFTSPISDMGEILFKNLDNQVPGHAPLICYYSTQRLYKDISKTSKNIYDSKIGRRNGYNECLNEYANKKLITDWLIKATNNRTTQIYKGIYKPNNILENVELAIKNTLIDFLEINHETKIDIYFNSEDNQLYVRYDENHDLPLNYYSDGFRNLIFLVFDMVWRSSQINPEHTLKHLTNVMEGVVIIDEIDLHLHPKWQAKAISTLQKLFPKVQFFITTHSPTVVANFEQGTLYVVEKNQVRRINGGYFARQINDVIVNILEGNDRHKPTQEKINTLLRLIDDNKKEEYEPLLKELTELLGEDDFEIMQANTLIEMSNIPND